MKTNMLNHKSFTVYKSYREVMGSLKKKSKGRYEALAKIDEMKKIASESRCKFINGEPLGEKPKPKTILRKKVVNNNETDS